MDLKNKKIAFLGDSITYGHGVSDHAHRYWELLSQRSGARCYGYGICGTRIAPQHTLSPDPSWDRYFASRIGEMIPDADIVVVFGGTNDFGHGDAVFGCLSDRSPDSFCGVFHVLMEKLVARYPQSQLIVMTPLHRECENQLGLNELGVGRDHNLEAYVDAIKSISGYYGVPVLDLFRTSGMQPSVPQLKERDMPDGLHPNDAGHERIAEKLPGFLNAL